MMDNMDGKQARRTKSSSALGMLFDHGCDAFVAGMIPLVLIQVTGTTGWESFLVQYFSLFSFLVKVLEQKAIGELILGYINPVDEGLIVVSLALIFSGITGNEIWTKDSFVSGITWRYILILTYIGFGIPFCFFSLFNSVKICGLWWTLKSLGLFALSLISCSLPIFTKIPDVEKIEMPLLIIFFLLSGRLIVDSPDRNHHRLRRRNRTSKIHSLLIHLQHRSSISPASSLLPISCHRPLYRKHGPDNPCFRYNSLYSHQM